LRDCVKAEVDSSNLRKYGVLLIIAQLPPPVHGASVVNESVVKSRVLADSFDVEFIPIDVAKDLSDLRKFGLAKVWRSLRILCNIVLAVVRFRPVLAYLTLAPSGYAFYRDFIFVLSLKILRVPRVFHLHGRGMRGESRGRVFGFFARFLFKGATVIHLSPLLLDDIATLVPENNIRIVANGVDDPNPTLNQRCNKPIADPSEPCILFLSTMLESKGPLTLLSALKILKDDGVAFRAVFAGPWRGSILPDDFHRQLQAAGLANQVSHRGALYGSEKNALLAEADIFAFPTHYEHEAFPLVVLEAMAAGLVPVTSDIAALPDMVGDCGIVVPPKAPQALANALKDLLLNPELRSEFQKKARHRYENRFTKRRFEETLTRVLVEAAVAGRKAAE
jgi:glycosyltransferase involved in cell wall biosynthesis